MSTQTSAATCEQMYPRDNVITLPPRQTVRPIPKAGTRWRRLWAKPAMMQYHRLFALVCLANILVFLYGLSHSVWWQDGRPDLSAIANVVLANFAMAILIRQHHVINLLFRIATSAPKSWPLAIRRRLGKVYHFGGLHSGGASMGSLWYMLYLGALVWSWQQGVSPVSTTSMIITAILMTLLVGIVVMSLPGIRARYHNQFELMHRLGGWSALGLFWLQFLSVTLDTSATTQFGSNVFSAPAFWILALITFSIVLPWTRLRKVPVEINTPSSHVAIARLNYGVTPFAGSSTAISLSPLKEWHAFANIPAPGEPGFRLAISRAGDWTGDFIRQTPSHVWVKAIPTAGVGNVDKLFRRVVWIATGSGVGPCIPHLLANYTPSLLVWSTRSPRETYGDELVDEIMAVQPDAMIWDTDERGKPDMLQLAWEACQKFDAEAVICISNKKLTWQVVSGLESRGIPAYGAIWDS